MPPLAVPRWIMAPQGDSAEGEGESKCVACSCSTSRTTGARRYANSKINQYTLSVSLTYWSSAVVAYPLWRVLCVQRCSSAYHCCNVWLFALLSTSCQLCRVWPFSSDLSLIMNAFLPAELLLTGCFLVFAPFSANSRDCCVWKSQAIGSFWDTQSALSGTNVHQSHLDHIS